MACKMPDSENPVSIGIDLGTTHCCVAYINENGTVDIIANSDGHRTTPSYIMLTETEILIGKVAKDEFYIDPKNVVYDSKRLIGRKFDDKYIQEDIKNWTFKVKESNNQPIIELCVNDGPVCCKPQEISAMLLAHMKNVAEEYIGKSVSDAVITVPAHFNYHQRTATAEACRLAGLNVLGIINEPTAAALAYIHKNKIKDAKNVLVFDLGGGTLDVSIVQVKSNTITVTATGGNTHLGGRDFDNNLKNLISRKIIEKYGEKGLKSEVTNRRIRQATENIKIKLSTVTLAVLDLQYLQDGEDVELKISRTEFEEINADLFKSAIDIVEYCLADAKLEKTEIDDVVLVGGSTRIPKIQKMLSDFFDGKTLRKSINPDEAVAYGAAVQTAKFTNSNKSEALAKIIDVTPLSLGVDLDSGLMDILVPRNSTIPITVTTTYVTAYDKVTRMIWNIYEGERSFVADNVHLGKCTLKLLPKPPGYSVDFTFHVDEDGILKVSARDKSGLHTSMSIDYEQHDSQTVSNIINDAKVNKSLDSEKEVIAHAWTSLSNYCTKLKAICDYDKKGMTTEDKDQIKTTANDAYNWLKDFPISTFSFEDILMLLKKHDEVKNICEPIANKYGYEVYDLDWDEFHELITK